MSLWTTTLPLHFCNLGPNTAFFWDDTCFLLSLCASRITSFLLLTISKSHAGIVSSFFHSLVHCSFCIRNLHRLWHRNKLAHHVVMCQRSKSFTSSAIFMNLGLQRFCSLSRGFMSTIHPYIVMNSFSLPIFGIAFAFAMLGCLLHGIAGATSLSNFLHFWEFLDILCHPDRWSKSLTTFEQCRASVFLLPILVFLDSDR